MITEKGRIVAIEPDCLWVETVQKSTCGSCAMKKGCGHSLLNDMGANKRNHVRVLLDGQNVDNYLINDEVVISVPERVVVLGALLVYLVPLITLLFGAILASLWWEGDIATLIGSIIGFGLGIGIVRLHSMYHQNNAQWQPIVLPQASYTDTMSEVIDIMPEAIEIKVN